MLQVFTIINKVWLDLVDHARVYVQNRGTITKAFLVESQINSKQQLKDVGNEALVDTSQIDSTQ